jgi:hypothetical protein
MKRIVYASLAGVALGSIALITPASALPLPQPDVGTSAQQSVKPDVEKATFYRHRWHHRGHRGWHRGGPRIYFGFGGPRWYGGYPRRHHHHYYRHRGWERIGR